MFTRRLLLQSGMATLLLDQLLNPLHAEAAPMIVVTPVKADLAANIGFNVKPEDFNTTQGPYATMWDSNPGVLTWLAQSKVRFARVGGGPPSGDSPAHKAEYFDRCREMVAQGIGLAAVVASTTGIANMDAHYQNMSSGWKFIEGQNEPTSCLVTEAFQTQLYLAVKSDSVVGPPGANLPVVGPALTTFVCAVMSAVADVGDWHTYIHGKWPESKGWMTGYLDNAHDTVPNRPVMISELGYRSVQPGELPGQNRIAGVPDDIIARYVARWVIFNLHTGFSGPQIFHQLCDNHVPSPTDEQTGYGFVDFSGHPKPQLATVASLITLFADPNTFTPTPLSGTFTSDTGDVVFTLFQKSDGTYLLAFCRGISGWDDVHYIRIDNSHSPATSTITVPATALGQMATLTTFADDGTTSNGTIFPSSVGGNAQFQISTHDRLMVLAFKA